jgi:hypothetical protein
MSKCPFVTLLQSLALTTDCTCKIQRTDGAKANLRDTPVSLSTAFRFEELIAMEIRASRFEAWDSAFGDVSDGFLASFTRQH